jgi:acetyl-CoA C-acetyltransferase
MAVGREVVVLSGVRTPVGNYGGSLKDFSPAALGAMVIQEAVGRAGVAPDDVGHVVFGHVIPTEKHDVYLARVAAVNAGLPVTAPAVTVNRLCGSGLQAIVDAAQTIMLGDAECTVAGGSESMSRGAYLAENHRWGQRMGSSELVDTVTGGLTDPFDDYPMGITAENVAESHRRAAQAAASGYFKEQILPVEVKSRKGTTVVDHDEHIRTDADLDSMAKLRPVFKKDGTVTAGNSSSMNDAASAVVLMDRAVAEDRGLSPMARLVGYSYAGVEPKYMGIGPVPAVKSLLKQTGLTVDDLDVIELNEAFAAQAIAVVRDLGLSEDKTNPNGSGISMGHPISATGSILTVKALYELERTSGRFALVTMCIGGGQGIAAIFERL